MPVVVVHRASFWELLARLRQFEGWRCLWRLPVAALAYALPALIFVGATVLAGVIRGGGSDLGTAVFSAIVGALATVLLAPRLARWHLHRKIISNRLWTFQKPNPATEAHVLLRSCEAESARTALRRARFNPHVDLNLGAAPDDAPDLDLKIAVHEPEVWPQSESDEDRMRRIVGTLKRAKIRARVGGLEVFPTADEATTSGRPPRGRRPLDDLGDFPPSPRT